MKKLAEINAALDDGALELIKQAQAALAMRLGADSGRVTPEEEAADALENLRKIGMAHQLMRKLVMSLFPEKPS